MRECAGELHLGSHPGFINDDKVRFAKRILHSTLIYPLAAVLQELGVVQDALHRRPGAALCCSRAKRSPSSQGKGAVVHDVMHAGRHRWTTGFGQKPNKALSICIPPGAQKPSRSQLPAHQADYHFPSSLLPPSSQSEVPCPSSSSAYSVPILRSMSPCRHPVPSLRFCAGHHALCRPAASGNG